MYTHEMTNYDKKKDIIGNDSVLDVNKDIVRFCKSEQNFHIYIEVYVILFIFVFLYFFVAVYE